MERTNPSPSQKHRLLKANANKCCVCKRTGIGFNFHHIDGDPSNTIDKNLAVLCVEDHDRHHRPGKYQLASKHLELGAEELVRLKRSWEAFVSEANQPAPKLLATLACYGTKELIHSMQLVMQWEDERIEYTRSYHLLDGDFDHLTDQIIAEAASVGKNVKLVLIDEPLPIDHCPCCGTGLSRTMKPAIVARLTDPRWTAHSICSIYVNPNEPSLALNFSLLDKQLFSGSLHLCCDTHLHYSSEGIDERVEVRLKPSVRTQATKIVMSILAEWAPAQILIGTGPHESPTLIDDLHLPKIWEASLARSHKNGRRSGKSN
jgi:hypothetical protein